MYATYHSNIFSNPSTHYKPLAKQLDTAKNSRPIKPKNMHISEPNAIAEMFSVFFLQTEIHADRNYSITTHAAHILERSVLFHLYSAITYETAA